MSEEGKMLEDILPECEDGDILVCTHAWSDNYIEGKEYVVSEDGVTIEQGRGRVKNSYSKFIKKEKDMEDKVLTDVEIHALPAGVKLLCVTGSSCFTEGEEYVVEKRENGMTMLEYNPGEHQQYSWMAKFTIARKPLLSEVLKPGVFVEIKGGYQYILTSNGLLIATGTRWSLRPVSEIVDNTEGKLSNGEVISVTERSTWDQVETTLWDRSFLEPQETTEEKARREKMEALEATINQAQKELQELKEV